MFCQIDWSRLDRIATYHPSKEELAQPAEPILLAEVYYHPTIEASIAIARTSEPIRINWIKTLTTDEAVTFQRVPVVVR